MTSPETRAHSSDTLPHVVMPQQHNTSVDDPCDTTSTTESKSSQPDLAKKCIDVTSIKRALLHQVEFCLETATCCRPETWFQVFSSRHNINHQQLHGEEWRCGNAHVYIKPLECCPTTSETPPPQRWVRDDSPMQHCRQEVPRRHANAPFE